MTCRNPFVLVSLSALTIALIAHAITGTASRLDFAILAFATFCLLLEAILRWRS